MAFFSYIPNVKTAFNLKIKDRQVDKPLFFLNSFPIKIIDAKTR